MKSLSIALVLGAIAAALPVQAQAPAKPWTQADYDQRKAVVANSILPMLEAVNNVAGLSMTDPANACAAAKQALSYIEVGKKDLAVLEARLRAEGKDLGPVNADIAKMNEMTPEAVKMEKTACSVDLTKGSAEDRAEAAEFMGYVQKATAAQTASIEALQRGDKVTSCLKVDEATLSLDQLDAFLARMKTKYRAHAATVTELDALGVKMKGLRDKAVEAKANCQAGQ